MQTLILLATYNGERFLSQQLDSIVDQTDPDWRLLVHDDGSGDNTRELITRVRRQDPRVELLPDSDHRYGAMRNFAYLMSVALERTQPYIAFCDQDDVWMPQKLARQKATMADLERIYGADCPILIHSDLAVIDQERKPVHPSMMQLHLIRNPATPELLTLLAQNHVVGCTILMNRALLALATPLPDDVHMHDWWVTLCASVSGIIQFLPEPLVDYRQHGKNQVGAQSIFGRLIRVDHWFAWLQKMNRIYRTAFFQAQQLELRISTFGQKNHSAEEQLQVFLQLIDKPQPLRPWYLMRMGQHCQNPLMTVLFYAQSLALTARVIEDRSDHEVG